MLFSQSVSSASIRSVWRTSRRGDRELRSSAGVGTIIESITQIVSSGLRFARDRCGRSVAVIDSKRRSKTGEMAEWLKAHAWKACIPQGIQGSNPCLSASFRINDLRWAFAPYEILKREH